MKMLNEEFNYFRGLFPLKVFITGPPCSGKTHFASKLNELYGIPHIKIADIIAMGRALDGGYGDVVKQKIEDLKDQAEIDYDKSKKKKDPDFDRTTCNPRLPDEVVYELVKIQLNSAGCMNKGFILEGYPRNETDSRNVFMDKIPKPLEEGQEEPEVEEVVNQKIVPQYALALEAEDALLFSKAKELAANVVEGTHWNDQGMQRRMKEYRAKNPESGNVRDFFAEIIGLANVLDIDIQLPQDEQLSKMKEIIEQKGKPCCINMITESDRRFLANLDKQAQKEARAKAREDAANAPEATHDEAENDPTHDNLESEEEVDEIS